MRFTDAPPVPTPLHSGASLPAPSRGATPRSSGPRTTPRGSAPRTQASRPAYLCTECGWTTTRWVGRCGECQAWGTIDETRRGTAAAAPRTRPSSVADTAIPIAAVDATVARVRSTGVAEFDRVLGGGLVAGAVVLVAGEPGIGKSTLLLDVAARAARTGRRVLYVTAEESAAQVRLRAARIGALADGLYLAAETDLAAVLGQIEVVEPQLLVVDSVQTVASGEIDGTAGNVAQVREVAACLIQAAKDRALATLLVGHVTKEGSIAGPRVLEHLVDVVIQFEGDRHTRLRLVRATKNRYGPTDEVGCFDLSDAGIEGLTDPSGLFLSGRDRVVPGTSVTVALEGRRPLVAEVQALLTPTKAPAPRRTTSGLDPARVAMLLAVLERHGKLPVGGQDCYVSTVGGVRLREPASDLAIGLAIASSVCEIALPPETIAVGEVGLAGEIRPATGVPRRLSEAARFGFTRAIVPAGSISEAPPRALAVVEVADIMAALRISAGAPPR